MKYIFLVGDGMADEPLESIGGKTPLEVAKIDNLQNLAKNGIVGLCKTVPDGMPPGSDVANLSLLGFDPSRYYTGRGPLEAAASGIPLDTNDCAFRCNLVNIQNGIMNDFTSGHISTQEADEIINDLNKKLSSSFVHFYTGVQYRHICIIKGDFKNLQCTPPHDISGREIKDYLPKGDSKAIVNDLMNRSKAVLNESRVNRIRIEKGKLPATQIWLWGQGYKPQLSSFYDRFGVHGSVITAVDLIRGIGKLIGLDIIEVDGATGFVDTNYEGKADAALNALQENDFVFIHVEAPDESSHMGDVNLKIKSIEDIDKRLLGRILNNIKGDYRILVMPDHPTPIRIKTHSNSPVPFIIYGKGIEPNDIDIYSEKAAERSNIFIKKGHTIIDLLFK